jgi:hypothetical protein
MCQACGKKPQAYGRRRFCFDCKPGIGGLPHPCRKCGSPDDYWTNGLCARCHRLSPRRVGSCLDCLAWGALRRDGWLCEGCRGWRRNHRTVDECIGCGRHVHLDDDRSCRLCRRQRLQIPPAERNPADVVAWHQLFFAGMLRTPKSTRPKHLVLTGGEQALGDQTPSSPRPHPRHRYCQLTLFEVPAVARPPFRARQCPHCGRRPVKMAWADHCHACTPSGPVTPPPCRRCGSRLDYYSAGLCARCHKYAPVGVGSCIDCFAWGATRANSWRCEGCRGWRKNHRPGVCSGCDRPISVGPQGACRLCYLDAARRRRRDEQWEFTTRYGQQLSFADMRRKAGRRRQGATPRERRPLGDYPVRHRRQVLFAMAPDLVAGARGGFSEPKDPELVRYLDHYLGDYASSHGWGVSTTGRTRQGLRILCALQDTPGAPIKATDAMRLPSIDLPADPVLVVLEAAGMLEDDRPSTFGPWLDSKIDGLPPAIVHELQLCAEVLLHGNPTPPRMRPRPRKTVQATIRHLLPAVQGWVEQGHASLREITRHDVFAALPASGAPRASMVSALRHLFRILKARKVVFVNPTARIRTGAPSPSIPLPADLEAVRAALRSHDPTIAALAGLVAFHALTPAQLRLLCLTDVRDGRLHLDGRAIVVAEPARQRLSSYLDHRARRWPATANPYLFLHHRNALRTSPVHADWISKRLGGLAQAIRQDRILDELLATGGDIRRLCDLFGLSIAGAERYLGAMSHPELEDPGDRSPGS